MTISMTPTGSGPDGSQYFLMLPTGRVLLQESIIGKAGQVYRFNVTVSSGEIIDYLKSNKMKNRLMARSLTLFLFDDEGHISI